MRPGEVLSVGAQLELLTRRSAFAIGTGPQQVHSSVASQLAYRRPVIIVADYDPRWPDRFEALRSEHASALADASVAVIGIEHIGSTSVPGLAAKPVIDIDIVVARSEVIAAGDVLVSLGFRGIGELGIPDRWAFKEPERLAATNTYVVVAGSLALRNHLAIREHLRGDPSLRAEYGAVKKLVAADAANIDDYGRGKNSMVQKVLAAAGLSDEERASINGNSVPSHDEIPR